MHICMIIDCLDFGGAERVAMTLANTLINEGKQVTIVTINPIINIDVDKRINLYTLNFEKKINKYRFNRRKMYTLLDSIERDQGTFHLVLVHLFLASKIMKKYEHPACYHIVHSTQSKSALKTKKGFARLKAKYKIQRIYNDLNLICVSGGVKDDILDVMNVKPRTIQVIYNPFDINGIRLQANIKIAQEHPYIIFVGRLVKEKRIDYLIKAYHKSNISQKLLILGDGEEKESLKKMAISLGIKNKVIFQSAVKNPYPFINNADCLILSSLYEGLPTVLIESLILRTPIISTNCPSGPYEIMQYYTMDALVNDNNSIDDLTLKIIQRMKTQEKPTKDCVKFFDTKEISKRYLSLAIDEIKT